MSKYTISGRKITEVIDNIIKELSGYYQVNKEVMDDEDRIETLENIVDLINIKETVFKI